MPLHNFRCVGNPSHEFERLIPLVDWDKMQRCACGARADVFFKKFPGMQTPGGASVSEDRAFYLNHNVTYRAGTPESEVMQAPNSHANQCQCESCGRHRRRASVTEVADVNKEVRI